MHGDPPCKPPSEAPLFSASDDHGPILLVLMTGAGTCPPAGWGSLPRVLWGIPGPGGGLTDSHPMDTCSLCSRLLGPRDVEGLRGSCRGWAREPPESGGRKELGWEVGAEVLAWPHPMSPLCTCSCPLLMTRLLRKPPPHPNFVFLEVYRLWCISPKSLACVLGFFFLVFRFFLNKVFF